MDALALSGELLLALLCERYHKLPSEVLAEDARLLSRTWELQGVIDEFRRRKNG